MKRKAKKKARAKPVKFTQRMVLHLNGGEEWSELRYQVFANGRPTPILRTVRTDGSPHYRVTLDEFWHSDTRAHFVMLKSKRGELRRWLMKNMRKRA